MEIAIRGRNVEVSDPLRRAVEDKVTHLEVCEVTMHGHGHIVRAKASASDIFAAVDRVAGKLEHRMERLKGKLIGRSHPRRHGSVDFGTDRTSADEEDLASDGEEGAGQARIVKTKAFHIKPMTPEEAALQMELLGHDFFFFTNAETSRAAVVYRRDDGHVGLIDATR
jgi:putative sigma-54 modulation protein